MDQLLQVSIIFFFAYSKIKNLMRKYFMFLIASEISQQTKLNKEKEIDSKTELI